MKKLINLIWIAIAIGAGANTLAMEMEPEEKKQKQLIKEERVKALSEELIETVKARRLEVVKSLLEQGANVNFLDDDELTPLMHAAHGGYKEIIQCLVHAGADMTLDDVFGYTALMHAASENHLSAIPCLIESGADVNQQPFHCVKGETALMHAAYNGHYACCTLLLQYGAAHDMKNGRSKTALDQAIAWQNNQLQISPQDNPHAPIINLLSDPTKIANVISDRENNLPIQNGFSQLTSKHKADDVCTALQNRELGII